MTARTPTLHSYIPTHIRVFGENIYINFRFLLWKRGGSLSIFIGFFSKHACVSECRHLCCIQSSFVGLFAYSWVSSQVSFHFHRVLFKRHGRVSECQHLWCIQSSFVGLFSYSWVSCRVSIHIHRVLFKTHGCVSECRHLWCRVLCRA